MEGYPSAGSRARERPRTCASGAFEVRVIDYFTRTCTVALPGRVVVVVVTRTRRLPTRTVLLTRRVAMAVLLPEASSCLAVLRRPRHAHLGHFGMVLQSSRQVGSARPRPDKQPRSGPSSCLRSIIPGGNDTDVIFHNFLWATKPSCASRNPSSVFDREIRADVPQAAEAGAFPRGLTWCQ